MSKRVNIFRVLIIALIFGFIFLNLHCPNEQPILIIKYSPTHPVVGEEVTIDGSKSFDPEGFHIRFWWTLYEKPLGSTAHLSDSLLPYVKFTPDVKGVYRISVTVRDEHDKSTYRSVTISVASIRPIADAGPNQFTDIGSEVVIDGSNTSDPKNRPLSYEWNILNKPVYSVINTDSIKSRTTPVAHLTLDEPGQYQLLLRVYVTVDPTEDDRDTVLVTSNSPQIISINPDSGGVGTAVTITGKNYSSHLPNGNEVEFNGTAATITGASDSRLMVEVPSGATTGPISVRITETGYMVSSSQNFVVIGPISNAGLDQMVDVATTVILDGSGSEDPFGRQFTYFWQFIDKPAFSNTSINFNTNEVAEFVMDEPGIYEVELEVNVIGTTENDLDTVVITSNPAEINSFDPMSGPEGTAVTIFGKNYSSSLSPAGNQVTFNGYLAAINSASHDQIVALVPAAATTGPIGVRIIETQEFVESSQNFTVTNPGSPWTTIQIGGSNLYDVTFIDDFHGIIVGNGGTILRTTDGGVNWLPVSSVSQKTLFDVSFANTDTGYAVGEDGTILQTMDGGQNWDTLSSGTDRDLRGVFAIDDTTVYVVGAAGTARRTFDSGLSWEAVNTGGLINYDVWFTGKYVGYVVTSQGQIRGTINGGQSWNTRYQNSSRILEDIVFADSLSGEVVGSNGLIVHTVNGGTSWSVQNSNTQEYLRGVSFIIGNPDVGFAVGDNGTILRTINGGINWDPENSGVIHNLHSVFTIDNNRAIAVGSSGIILRRE